MRRMARLMAGVVLLGAIVGCGGSQETSPAAAGPARPAAQTGPGPDATVFEFLQAVKVGDDEQAAEMLTRLAREKTAELDLVVAPPGSETATFEVGEVEMIEDGGAYVSSTWTDVDPEGNAHSDRIVWVLRRDPEGWRIAGMVTALFENKLVLNFENPEDMLRKQQLIEEEFMRRAQEGAQQPPQDAHQAQQAPAGGAAPVLK